MLRKIILFFALMVIVSVISAQEQPTATPTPIEPTLIEIDATDGLNLKGSFYSISANDQPAVLLLHQLYTTRVSWNPVVNPLLEAGYKVLAVDLRGYGQTRGRINWTQASEDVKTWVEWLDAQPGVTSVAIMGSSMGSSLALTGCALSECAGAVAISPGLNYFNLSTRDAMQAGFSSLLIYSDHDTYPARDVPTMAELGGENVTVQMYAGRTHGVDLFKTQDDLLPLVIDWLNNHR